MAGKAGPQIAALLTDAGLGQGYAQNHARAPDSAGEQPLCDCVDEIAAGDAARVDELLTGPLREINGYSDRVGGVSGVWTEETVLYPANVA